MTMELDMIVGRRIRLRRLLLGWTQKALGERVGVTPQMVHKWETAQSALFAETLFRLSQAMGVPMAYFFSEPEQDEIRPRRSAP
jgi:transcriptional regulator with XRE-family HTH domain